MSAQTKNDLSNKINENQSELYKKEGVTKLNDRKPASANKIKCSDSNVSKDRNKTKQPIGRMLEDHGRPTKPQTKGQKTRNKVVPNRQPKKLVPPVPKSKPQKDETQILQVKKSEPPKQKQEKPEQPKPDLKKKGKKPLERCFGNFKCNKCDWNWSSACTWRIKDTLKTVYKQKCKKCKEYTFPYHTEYLKCGGCGNPVRECTCSDTDSDSSEDEDYPHHRADLCGKCNTATPCAPPRHRRRRRRHRRHRH